MSVLVKVFSHPVSAVGMQVCRVAAEDCLAALLARWLPGQFKAGEQPIVARKNGVVVTDFNACELVDGDEVSLRPRMGADPITIAVIAFASAAAVYSYTQVKKMKSLTADTNYRDLPQQSTTYDVNAQGNSARLNQPVPVGYGCHRIWPDFASASYRRFEGNYQYLYHLFSITQGKAQLLSKRIGDTPLENFEDYQEQLCMPGEKVTLFAPDVLTSEEVSNIELFAPNDEDYDGWSGPYVVTPEGSLSRRIELDLVCQGLYEQDSETGDLRSAAVDVEVQYCEIDDNDEAVGSWLTLLTTRIEAATVDVVRRTVGNDVPVARYQVRVRRTNNTQPDNSRLRDDVIWSELRGVLDSDATFDHTVWAVKIRVTGQLSSLSERKFNCKRQRLLDVWDGSQWVADQVTRSPAWAFCDMIKGRWGAGFDDDSLDLFAVKAFADTCAARGDYFDYDFDTTGTLDDALAMMCRAGRAEKIEYAGVYSIVRDELKEVADYDFGMSQIMPGSFEVEYDTQDQWGDDSVEVEYVDADTGLTQYVLCVLPGRVSQSPRKMKFEGITDRNQVYREGMFEAAVMEHRNRTVKIKTEGLGGLPDYGSSVRVSHAMSRWGTSGVVLDVVTDEAAGVQRVLLSEPVSFEEGKSYVISFTSQAGRSQGPYVVLQGAADDEVLISASENAEFYLGFKALNTAFIFGEAEGLAKRFIAREINHVGDYVFSLSGVLDDPRVHSFDDLINSGDIPVPVPAQASSSQLGQVRGLRVEYSGSAASPVLNLSWSPVSNADYYIVQLSRDGGETWQTFEQTTELWLQKSVQAGDAKLRIAAMNGIVGPWYQTDITPGANVHQPNSPTGLALVSAFVGKTLSVQWDAGSDAVAWVVNVVSGGAVKRSVRVTSTLYEYSYLDAQKDGASRDITIRVWAEGRNEELSAEPAELVCSNPQVGALANVMVDSLGQTAMVQADVPTVADYAGLSVWVGESADFVPSDSNLVFDRVTDRLISVPLPADYSAVYIRVAGVDVWGSDDLTYSPSYEAKRLQITETEIKPGSVKTPHLAANSVVAEKMLIERLSAISAQLGDIAGGSININDRFKVTEDGVVSIESSDGSMSLDVLNRRFLMNDAQGNEAVLIGDDGTGNRVVRVSKNGKSTTLTPDALTLIGSGEVTVGGVNSDGSIGTFVNLGDTYDVDDLEVVLTFVSGEPAIVRNPHWLGINDKKVFSVYNYLDTNRPYYQTDGVTSQGFSKFKSYTGPKGGDGASYVTLPLTPIIRWDKPSAASISNVLISAYWNYDAEAGGWHSIIDCYAPFVVQYQIFARNYKG